MNLIIAVAAPATSSVRRSSSLFSIDMLWALNGMAQGIALLGFPLLTRAALIYYITYRHRGARSE